MRASLCTLRRLPATVHQGWRCWRCRCCLLISLVYTDNTVYTVLERSRDICVRHSEE